MKQIYRDNLNESLSPLGFGLLYLPTDGNNLLPLAYELIDKAMENGINYYDTGYLYLSGKCERYAHELLVKRYPRNEFKIGAKMPSWFITDEGKSYDEIFELQLSNLGVDSIDFYFVQSIMGMRWQKIIDSGMMEYLYKMRDCGIIKHLGFSFHDGSDVLKLVLEAYDWEFALIQLNYIDWIFQNAKANYELLEKYGVPCMVMQPTGGGRLANLPEPCATLLTSENKGASQASWAMRFVSGLSNVVCTLSGMNTHNALDDNIKTFEAYKPLSDNESMIIKEVRQTFVDYSSIPCPGCGYCTDYCPQKLNIPGIFRSFNDCKLFNEPLARFFVNQNDSLNGDRCIDCGACSKRCPQKLDIPKLLKYCRDEANANLLGIHKNVIYQWLDETEGGIVLFGAGMFGRNTLKYFLDYGRSPDYFCDNNKQIWGSELSGILIISPEELKKIVNQKSINVLITALQDKAIADLLDMFGAKYETCSSLNSKYSNIE